MLQNIFSALSNSGSQTSNPQQPDNQQPAGGDLLSGLLGAFMGGQSSGGQQVQPAEQTQTAGGELSNILGMFLGGQTGGSAPASGSQAGVNPLVNLVGSGQNPMLNMLIQPIVDKVAVKLGISPAIAMTVVTFAVHYMLANHGNKLAKGQDLGDVLQQHTDHDHLHSTGLTKELADQTGLTTTKAAHALSEVFNLLGATAATP
jgi:hypothetical protein